MVGKRVLVVKEPPKIWLTTYRKDKSVRVCWNSPFRASKDLGNSFNLEWTTSENFDNSI